MGGGESGAVSRRSRAFEPSGQCANSDRFDVNPQGGAVLPELINRPALTLSPEPENEMTDDPNAKLTKAIERVTEMADRWEDDAKLEDMVRAGLQSELDLFHETPRPPNVNLRLVRAAVDAESNATGILYFAYPARGW